MLGGCGNSGSASSASDSASQAPGTEAAPQSNSSETTASSGSEGAALTISWWGNQARNERTQQVLELYSNANEGITFDGQFTEWADYWTKLAVASAGHTLSDIIQMDYSYLEQYVSNGLLVDLTPYIEDGTIDITNLIENALNPGKVGDGIYAVSAGVNVPTIVYNKTLLDENGITVKDNMNLEEFYEVCREVYEKTGYKTDVFYGNGADYLGYVMRGEGTHLYGDDGKFQASEEDLKKFFDIYETGITEGWMCGPSIYAERTVRTPEQMPLVYGSSPETMSWCSFTWSNSLASLRNVAAEVTQMVNQLVEKVCYGELNAAEAASQLYTQGSALLEK